MRNGAADMIDHVPRQGCLTYCGTADAGYYDGIHRFRAGIALCIDKILGCQVSNQRKNRAGINNQIDPSGLTMADNISRFCRDSAVTS